MAQKFGGKYSPDDDRTPPPAPPAGSQEFRGAVRSRIGLRSNLLFLLPLPLILKAFRAEPVVMAQYLAALGVLILAAWLTREGLRAEEAYEARKIARRPAMPRKIIGAISLGLGLGLVGIAGFGPVDAGIFAVLGAVLHLMAFGLDPLKDKGMEGIDTFQTDRVARAVEEAEAYLAQMRDAMARAGDRQASRQLQSFEKTARDLFRKVEEDPRDLSAARKYLSVYLMGARDATVRFADIYSRSGDAQARDDYMALLNDLEQNFAARTEKFLLEDRSDLTIEIEVLRDRLKREGLTVE
ncbi:5-bromo-4-chloroindolyl phosphate hydrolysis family protein [Thalassovita mediterranea]|jgi:hypothetical protein|uniref:5-bromo-4-chloroindolyl phosphate hydrolysis protein n=1 Tax=Thalassovita mediterranea TaxID=340021 RepID=A0A0P1HG32_9RHOB|nr:5-bromo-4-chloroindolyl phosphate hydrolysis family protein [Thalassovita mediterranea]CUH85831.1 5-bromo-4-chloroindolyl phosphate hydrolysis protein [Thalassovita mediterranea]SIS32614.1 5-bromo-4-chloroindolyl phosphate hydrolysis protein [Thalassovita mediterranea]